VRKYEGKCLPESQLPRPITIIRKTKLWQLTKAIFCGFLEKNQSNSPPFKYLELYIEDSNWHSGLHLNGKVTLSAPANQRRMLPIERKVRGGGSRGVIDAWRRLSPRQAPSQLAVS